MTGAPKPRTRLPRGIWMLGFVSLLMDVSSELIHSLLPVYLATGLGASMATVGLLEGAAEATALIVKVFSGTLSDWWGRRKPLALLGYGLSALTKPLFALATSVEPVVFARLADRVGKGIRGAPRDALVADIAPPDMRGAAFGLRQSLDTIGAFVGPLLAMGLMLLWHNDFQAVFWVAVLPAAMCVALLLLGVQEPDRPTGQKRGGGLRRDQWRALGFRYWWVVGLGAVFTLARFSEAFLVLRAQQGGLPVAWVPMVLIVMNAVYALGAYPCGRLADTMDRGRLLMVGVAVLILADALLAWSGSGPALWLGIALWGVHMAMTQGLLAAMVTDASPAELRGTAFGLFNLVAGMALLVASGMAGLLWDQLGASATFGTGAVMATLSLLLLAARPQWEPDNVRK